MVVISIPPSERISIHAPTRGATQGIAEECKYSGISIHAPTRGATFMPMLKNYLDKDFNPRSHEGSDDYANIDQGGDPTFQSTLPRGERLTTNAWFIFIFLFQSTLPRGERLTLMTLPSISYYFNPRSHEGSDPALICLVDV